MNYLGEFWCEEYLAKFGKFSKFRRIKSTPNLRYVTTCQIKFQPRGGLQKSTANRDFGPVETFLQKVIRITMRNDLGKLLMLF